MGHLLTRSGLTYPEVSSKVCHDSFCQLGNSVSLPWVIYYDAFYLHENPIAVNNNNKMQLRHSTNDARMTANEA